MELARHIKYESDLDRGFTEELSRIEGCERIWHCIQCGTCSGTCPLSIYMDYTPRRLIAMAREGFESDVLGSFTIWLCSSCYACTVKCPRKIQITDLMYAFKRKAIEKGVYPKNFPIPVLAREFFEAVRTSGRNPEARVVMRLCLKSDPRVLLGLLGTGWHLFRTGRLRPGSESIRNPRELQVLLDAVKEGSR
jgi:heterodisulfide reductase subunit C